MKADFAWVWGGRRARRVIDLQGNQRLARNIGNGRLEVLRDGVRFAIMGVDGAGDREGEGSAGGGDDGSDLHGLSPSALRFGLRSSLFPPGLAGLLITDTERVSL